jgi:hypothetical protein
MGRNVKVQDVEPPPRLTGGIAPSSGGGRGVLADKADAPAKEIDLSGPSYADLVNKLASQEAAKPAPESVQTAPSPETAPKAEMRPSERPSPPATPSGKGLSMIERASLM